MPKHLNVYNVWPEWVNDRLVIAGHDDEILCVTLPCLRASSQFFVRTDRQALKVLEIIGNQFKTAH